MEDGGDHGWSIHGGHGGDLQQLQNQPMINMIIMMKLGGKLEEDTKHDKNKEKDKMM